MALQKKKILCVDDSSFFLQALITALRHLPYQIIAATNGDDALKSIFYDKPDLIFLDINMPGKDGFQVLKDTRTLGIKTPIVYLTASSSNDDLIKGYDTGCDYYISKPFKNEYVINIANYFLDDMSEEDRKTLEMKL